MSQQRNKQSQPSPDAAEESGAGDALPSIEVQFGNAVRQEREALGLSQRQLAAKLVEAGMTADTSAVSRIENGTRVVRINEAVAIADVLNADLNDLLDGEESPRRRLQEARDLANSTMREARYSLSAMLQNVYEVSTLLDEYPHLRYQFTDSEFGTPANGDEYIEWVLQRVKRLNTEFWHNFPVENDSTAERLQAIAATMATGITGTEVFHPPWQDEGLNYIEEDVDEGVTRTEDW